MTFADKIENPRKKGGNEAAMPSRAISTQGITKEYRDLLRYLAKKAPTSFSLTELPIVQSKYYQGLNFQNQKCVVCSPKNLRS